MTKYGIGRRGYLELGVGGPKEQEQKYSFSLRTLHLVSLHLLLSIASFIAGIYFEMMWFTEDHCRYFIYMVYTRCAFWIATYIIDILVTRQHCDLRRQGYHDFYNRKILTYKSVPFSIVTIWNMTIFLIQAIMLQNVLSEVSLSPGVYICTFCGLETTLLTIIHWTYIIKVNHFNSIHSLPDALRDMEQPFIGSLGISIENEKLAELLEKQVDLIYYLKEQNASLKQKLLQFNQRSIHFGSYEKI